MNRSTYKCTVCSKAFFSKSIRYHTCEIIKAYTF
ncbi:unnamed protein product [Brugia pahangi]|uniref:C2H2-type domain-containing protein n=1 Tax=Brugia pahangi TaxID=6280 RepID=A0A0N4TZF1_BRUPA|nr:unnamed protein product [Brugia pahangi]